MLKMVKSRDKLLVLGLNELNFDLVEKYVAGNSKQLPNFSAVLESFTFKETTSEQEYENLEPWIQWPSIFTGLSASEHSIFRLGDVVGAGIPQIFEKLERVGYRVGVISPMNAENRLLDPAFFVPDPWTDTPSDSKFFSSKITLAIKQAVNDNSSEKISIRSIFWLVLGSIYHCRFSSLYKMAKLALVSFGKPWRRALILDIFLSDLHRSLFKQEKPDFSLLWLNACAHIQHHYLFNSPHISPLRKALNPEWYVESHIDPFFEMLIEYDSILGDILKSHNTVALITGLSQKPYNQNKFYYRLTSHEQFLKSQNIVYKSVQPLMTRDFTLWFDDNGQRDQARVQLKNIEIGYSNNKDVMFGVIDVRERSLFITLTYPHEINSDTLIFSSEGPARAIDYCSFVAVKNGMHDQKGYFLSSSETLGCDFKSGDNVTGLYDVFLNFFDLREIDQRS